MTTPRTSVISRYAHLQRQLVEMSPLDGLEAVEVGEEIVVGVVDVRM